MSIQQINNFATHPPKSFTDYTTPFIARRQITQQQLTFFHSFLVWDIALLTMSLQDVWRTCVIVVSAAASLVLLVFSVPCWSVLGSPRSCAWTCAIPDWSSANSSSLICCLWVSSLSACWHLHSSSRTLRVSWSLASICRSSSFFWSSASSLACSSFLCCSCSLVWYTCSLRNWMTEISCCLSLFQTALAPASSALSRVACALLTCSTWHWSVSTSSCSSSCLCDPELCSSCWFLCFLCQCSSATLRAWDTWNN